MSARPNIADRDDGWGMTLAFWGTLLAAGALFAVVSLAPRLKTLSELDAEYAANQARLVELERRAIELEKVADSLEHDPAFAAELARLEFAQPRADGERIAVPEELRLGAGEPQDAPESAAPISRWTVPPDLIEPFATHAPLRATLLTSAAMLALLAFCLLNDAHAATVRTIAKGATSAARNAADRYRSPPAEPSPPARRRNAA